MRRQAKWAFVFLALVFAGGFVFLGVGSGQGSGLGDAFQNIFQYGSSGPSVKKLQEQVAKNPSDAAAYLQLGQALEQKQRLDEAITAYRRYIALRPSSLEGLNQLAALYEQKARLDELSIQAAVQQLQSTGAGLFGPSPSSKLGQALSAFPDPISSTLAADANTRYQAVASHLQATRQGALDVYRRIARLEPDEPSAQLQYAFAAQQAADLPTALQAYRTFVTKFPDDPSVPDAKRQIKELTKQIAAAGTAGSSLTVGSSPTG